MGGAWRWAIACGWLSLLAARGSANPLESLHREHWVSLDSTATDQATDVATGAGGSMVYISGYRQRAPTGADGSQSIEAFVMAYNSSGVCQWVAEYGSSGEDLGNSVAADATGVYLAGTESVPRNSSRSSSTDDTDAFVVKYNSTGGLLWKTSWGTSQPDLGNGVAVDGGSGLVYVVGTTRGSMSSGDVADGNEYGTGGLNGEGSAAGEAHTAGVNAGMSDVFLTCLSAANGEVQWTRQFGSSAMDVGNRVAVGPRGGVFAVGQLGDDGDSSLSGQRAFLAKYDYLGNAQFTARLNSTSAHYAVDLSPSVGSGGEGVVYMSGYTLGDSPSVFLARFEGSTGTQTWLSELGEESGPHLAQSVAVVEGSQFGFSLAGGGTVESLGSGSDGAPVVEGEEAATHGNDARIVVVGYNTSEAAADSHSSTGFTATADTDGNWAWFSASEMADRQTAIAIGQRQGSGAGAGESVAYIVGTVAAGDATPGNYLFLDIQKVVREGLETPAPSVGGDAALAQDALPDPAGGASSTTGLSQGSSLWLLIIAPIFVVLSCILLVSYVSKQCSVAFGTRPPQREPMDAIEYGSGGGGGGSRGVRTSRSLRREKNPPTDWNERSSGSPVNGGSERRRRRDSGSSGTGSGDNGGRKAAWPRSITDTFRDRADDGPPYRKLGMRERERSGDGGDDGGRGGGERGRTESPAFSSETPPESGEVELRQVTGQRHAPFGYPRRGEGSPGRRVRGGTHDGGVGGGHDDLTAFEDPARSNSGCMTADGWGAFEGDGLPGDRGLEEERSHDRYLTGRPGREGSPAQDPDPHRLL